MEYYKTLFVILLILILSLIVQDGHLFDDNFFVIAYIAMSVILVIGSKYKETYKVDVAIGLILIFSMAFLSTFLLIEMFVKAELHIFKTAIVFCLDVCAILFLSSARRIYRKLKLGTRFGPYREFADEEKNKVIS